MSDKMDLLGMTVSELSLVLADINEKPYRAKQIYDWLHNKQIFDIDKMANIPNKIKNYISDNFDINIMKKELVQLSGDNKTKKFLLKCSDNEFVETVLLSYKYGNSLCISSQIGCNMGCAFCASTVGGKVRNLKASEMLSQIYTIQRETGERVSNVVVMGTGEPLDNFDNLIKFIELLTDDKGLNISQRNITVSTCGLTENIKKLADKKFAITLAISLHAPTDSDRRRIMPIANKYTIAEILEATDYYFDKTGRRISYEYGLIDGENDTAENAEKLAALLKGKNCHVNLIPINPIKERAYKSSTPKGVIRFKKILENKGINVTIREEMGRDIDAACGQLRKEYMENNG